MNENNLKKEELIIFGSEAREKLLNGVILLARVVKETLGPRGRNVLLDPPGSAGIPTFSKDGVGVARRAIKSIKGTYANIGARAVLSASELSLKNAGDGTTSSVVLTEVLYRKGIEAVNSGANPILLKRQLEKCRDEVINELQKNVKVVDIDKDLYNVAMVSSNFDETISSTISDVFKNCGKDVTISMDRSAVGKTYYEKKSGYELDNCGPASSYFTSVKGRYSWEEEGVRILLVSGNLDWCEELDKFLNDAFISKQAKLLIIAQSFSDHIIQSLALNAVNNGICVNCVKLKMQGDLGRDILEDLAALTNTVIFGKDELKKIKDIEFNLLGVADKVVSRPDATVITGSNKFSEKVDSYVQILRDRLKEGVDMYNPVKENRLRERIAKLADGVCNIYIHAISDEEYTEIKEHYDDCICSCNCAVESGLLPGGGAAFIHALRNLEKTVWAEEVNSVERYFAIEIFKEVLTTPLSTLLLNCGVENEDERYNLIENLKKADDSSLGYDLNDSSYKVTNMFEAGIMDAAKVPINSLISAVSSAGTLLSTSVCIVAEKEVTPEMLGMYF